MEKKYDPNVIEKKWQDHWEKTKVFKAEDYSNKPKFYPLIEFPYPSGSGLHIGHPRPYTALDIVARKRRLQGYNVLFTMGWDAFGLPTENYAIQNKIHPRVVTERNIEHFKKQLKSLGMSFDWDREIDTTDPNYVKWTQWIFIKLFERGLAYKKEMTINWCPKCKVGLANEEVIQGACERCSEQVIQKPKLQWMLKITDYAEKLIDGLDTVDFIERVKLQQKNWIGRSEGAEIDFPILVNGMLADTSEVHNHNYDRAQLEMEQELANAEAAAIPTNSKDCACGHKTDDPKCCIHDRHEHNHEHADDCGCETDFTKLKIFTTRPDTIYGATYMVISPEHPIIEHYAHAISNLDAIRDYAAEAAKKSDFERSEMNKDKTGVKIEGISAFNPIAEREIPIFVSDYVLMTYGTGAIMSVPAHDKRDNEFAEAFGLPVIRVISNEVPDDEFDVGDHGTLINSPLIDGLSVEDAKKKIIETVEERKIGTKKVNYKLRDWVFSRQRYWGEPIPLVHCDEHGWVPIPEHQLPLTLPEVENYEPTDNGESPLSKMTDWIQTTCPVCGGPAKRETDTMPQWAGSSWYYLRYCDPHNDKAIADPELLKYWLPVDWYNGGMEHTTLHLLYSRFWHRFLYDIGVVPTMEPYNKRTSHGMILGSDGQKMSKSRGNVVSPDYYTQGIGADSLRLYEMFIGDFEKANPWNDDGAKGARRYLDKVWQLQDLVVDGDGYLPELESLMHKTIKKVTEDFETLKFNTAIAQLMTLMNEIRAVGKLTKDTLKTYLILLNPVAPHITEEIWECMGFGGHITDQTWPQFDENKTLDSTFQLAISINGKFKLAVEMPDSATQDDAVARAKQEPKITGALEGKTIVKTIYVDKKMLNFVVK